MVAVVVVARRTHTSAVAGTLSEKAADESCHFLVTVGVWFGFLRRPRHAPCPAVTTTRSGGIVVRASGGAMGWVSGGRVGVGSGRGGSGMTAIGGSGRADCACFLQPTESSGCRRVDLPTNKKTNKHDDEDYEVRIDGFITYGN